METTAVATTERAVVKFTIAFAVASLAEAQAMAASLAVKDAIEQVLADQLSVPKPNVNAVLTATARRLATALLSPVARRLAATLLCECSVLVPAGTPPNIMQSSVSGLHSQTASITQALALQLKGTNFANANPSVASISEPVVETIRDTLAPVRPEDHSQLIDAIGDVAEDIALIREETKNFQVMATVSFSMVGILCSFFCLGATYCGAMRFIAYIVRKQWI